MTEIQIRAANIADAAGIARVHVLTWQHAYRGQMPDDFLDSLSIAQRTQNWAALLSHTYPKAHTLVALDGDQVLGFCSVGASPNADADELNGEVFAIYVDPQAMGKGIGSALMAQAVAHLRADGFTHATLWVLASNTPSIRFYEHQGWSADGTTKTDTIGTFPAHELRYARRLDQA
ncbi:MAG: GNAT family N-acetyltransferase [Chloroflexi bacterium]|nr:GNAT family N-acetyltransferase [Chloroflexota bacterium]